MTILDDSILCVWHAVLLIPHFHIWDKVVYMVKILDVLEEACVYICTLTVTGFFGGQIGVWVYVCKP